MRFTRGLPGVPEHRHATWLAIDSGLNQATLAGSGFAPYLFAQGAPLYAKWFRD
ncbi:MAG: hypothetical protein KDA61_14165 [Planctomycetales bacterium]|nr:hypothetical protein [Planctomycetales bacterium]